MSLNVEKIRKDFPLFAKSKVVYFDNACMSLRPRQVIDKINEYYTKFPVCALRSYHRLSQEVTEEVAKARTILRKFFGAKKDSEIIFTKNTTEAINLVANSLDFKKGDIILVTDREHNSNLLPWQLIAKRKSLNPKIMKSDENYEFNLAKFEGFMKEKNGVKVGDENNGKVKLVSFVHTSNLDGHTLPVKEIIKIAHKYGALVLLDGAQSAPHKEINVRKLDVDFFACSGHKMLGPSGIGMLYGKQKLLDQMSQFMVGGETVKDSTYGGYVLEKSPERFEAGLQNYAGILGFAEATKYLAKVGLKKIEEHEHWLAQYIFDKINSDINNIKDTNNQDIEAKRRIEFVGAYKSGPHSGIINFNVRDKKGNFMDPHNIAMILDKSANIAVRSGAHCVHSWFNAHGLKGSVRASLYLYNTKEECDVFVDALKKLCAHF